MPDHALLAATEAWLGYAALAAVVILTFMSLRSSHRRMRGDGSPTTYARDQLARLKADGDTRKDMAQLLVELQELSRQINAQIDTKFAKLESSMRAADERIDRLERLLRASAGEQTVDAVVGEHRPQQQPADPPERTEPPAADATPGHREAVYRLADAGHNAVQIAQETGCSTGEIELILALRSKTGHDRPHHK